MFGVIKGEERPLLPTARFWVSVLKKGNSVDIRGMNDFLRVCKNPLPQNLFPTVPPKKILPFLNNHNLCV